MNKIQEFIKNNNLSLDGYGSDLNSTCCIIAGYALYENGDNNDFAKLVADITEDNRIELSSGAESELARVYAYAFMNNYEQWWHKPGAHTMYKF